MSDTVEDILKDIQMLLRAEGSASGRIAEVEISVVEDEERCPPLPKFKVTKKEGIKDVSIDRGGKINEPE